MVKALLHRPWWYVSVLALLLAACGGSAGPSGTATPTLVPGVTPSATLVPVGFLPTPIGTQSPLPIFSLTPMALATPAQDTFFQHPKDRLLWDGPGDRVSSILSGHCGDADPDYGVPALISLAEDRLTFWRTQITPREVGWRWTGYYHGEWQIWQGDDAWTIYLVHAREEAFAFTYHHNICI